jgi:hypothetical protein
LKGEILIGDGTTDGIEIISDCLQLARVVGDGEIATRSRAESFAQKEVAGGLIVQKEVMQASPGRQSPPVRTPDQPMKIGGKSSQEPKGDEEIGGDPVVIGGMRSSALGHMVESLVDGEKVKHGLAPAREVCARGGDGEVYVVLDVNVVDGGRVGGGRNCRWLGNGGGDWEDRKGIRETAEIERIGENWGGWCSGNIWPLLEGSLGIGIEGVDGWVLRIWRRS